ncbi:MAG: single-stranded DNA-binding protein [Acidobacteria bacterium]|nr:single-stranded DNA-binding protein [Acidobacteriota bacterium]
MPDNTITLVGNVTRDPELRYTPTGQANVRIGVAVNRVWNDRQTNERREQVSFFNVVGWGTLAENAGESLSKGSRVIITGRLEQRSYETPDGEKKSVVEVIADEIAPSLRWATAQVVRNERRPGEGGGFGGGDAPRGGGSRPAANEPPPAYDDEEPF